MEAFAGRRSGYDDRSITSIARAHASSNGSGCHRRRERRRRRATAAIDAGSLRRGLRPPGIDLPKPCGQRSPRVGVGGIEVTARELVRIALEVVELDLSRIENAVHVLDVFDGTTP